MEQDEKIKIENHNTMTNCNVFTGPVYGGTFPLPGSQPTINNYYGKEEPKQKPSVNPERAVISEEGTETPEEREQRKTAVLDDITRLFDFDERALMRDDNRNRITNERLALLFKRCLGVGAHLSSDQKEVIEQLWYLLIDKRNQCFKNPNEDFFRQTVLNILGYFREKGVICGNKLDLTRSVFKDADESLAKNIERGISSNVFPAGTCEIFNIYINKLMKGEI